MSRYKTHSFTALLIGTLILGGCANDDAPARPDPKLSQALTDFDSMLQDLHDRDAETVRTRTPSASFGRNPAPEAFGSFTESRDRVLRVKGADLNTTEYFFHNDPDTIRAIMEIYPDALSASILDNDRSASDDKHLSVFHFGTDTARSMSDLTDVDLGDLVNTIGLARGTLTFNGSAYCRSESFHNRMALSGDVKNKARGNISAFTNWFMTNLNRQKEIADVWCADIHEDDRGLIRRDHTQNGVHIGTEEDDLLVRIDAITVDDALAELGRFGKRRS